MNIAEQIFLELDKSLKYIKCKSCTSTLITKVLAKYGQSCMDERGEEGGETNSDTSSSQIFQLLYS